MKSNVTTGKGDSGQTRALDGTQFEKCHPMMEAVGTLDTLRTHTALLRLQLQEQYPVHPRTPIIPAQPTTSQTFLFSFCSPFPKDFSQYSTI